MIKYKKGYKYQLEKDYSVYVGISPERQITTNYINLEVTGWLEIRKGYAWDGPSGPSIDTKTFRRGSLVHDALYQLIRQEFLFETDRKEADNILKAMCIEDGMWWFRARYVHRTLSIFGGAAANPDNAKKVFTAP